jgi:hypothetical protein
VIKEQDGSDAKLIYKGCPDLAGLLFGSFLAVKGNLYLCQKKKQKKNLLTKLQGYSSLQ